MNDRSLHDDLEALELAAPVVQPPGLPASRHRPFMLWLPAGLALVAGVLIGLFSAQLLPREQPVGKVATSPLGPTPPPASPGQPAVAALDWTESSFESHGIVRALSAVDGRVFAAGSDAHGPAAWYSDDGGDSWTPSEIMLNDVGPAGSVATNQNLSLGRLVSFGDRLISLGTRAVGTSGKDSDVAGSIWTSADRGATWGLSPMNSPAVSHDIATNGRALVAVGRPPQAEAAEIWISSDGMTWRQVDAPMLDGAAIAGVAADRDGFLAVGGRDNSDGSSTAMTWTSKNGTDWSATQVATPGQFAGVSLGPSGFVAAGDVGAGDGRFSPEVLTTAGGSWKIEQISTGFDWITTAVAAGPLGTIVATQEARHGFSALTWYLPGGSVRAAREADPPGVQGLSEIVALPDGFVALSYCPPTADCFTASQIMIGRPRVDPTLLASPAPIAPSSPVGMPACQETPITLPPHAASGDTRAWRKAGEGLWGLTTPLIKTSDHGIKILWTTDEEMRGPLTVEVASIGTSNYRKSYQFDGETLSGLDHPSGFEMPPPGCYRFGARVGTVSGELVLQVSDGP